MIDLDINNDLSVKYQSDALDGFGRLPIAAPTTLFDAQFTYNLQPLLYEQVRNGTGTTVTHDATNRRATIAMSGTGGGGYCYLQTYEHFRYQPGKAQQIFITFNFGSAVANCITFARYGTTTNSFEFYQEGDGDLAFLIRSTSSNGDQIEYQTDWNLDKLDGTGRSGITLDITKTQILVIDFQALYVGRVRFGFDIDGMLIWCHEFNHANNAIYPYIQSANLPVAVGMYNSGTVTKTMYFQCCAVVSSGGQEETNAYSFSQGGNVTASNGARTHLLSIRPRTTFNSITNRAKIVFIEVDLLVTGNSPIKWELVLGQAISGTTAFNNVNSTYSTVDYNTAGTISGSPTIVIHEGYVQSSNQSKGSTSNKVKMRYPITLDAAGAVRSLGTVSLIVTGIGGSSACYGSLSWSEIR